MSDSPGEGDGAGSVLALAAAVLSADADDARGLVDLLDALERLKGAAAARQAELTAGLDAIRAGEAAAAGRRPADGGLAAEVALARRESPHRGWAHLRLSRALTRDLPATLLALAAGDISERRAEIVATESRYLTREQRLALDAELAGRLPGLGEHETREAARRIALRLDEAGWLARRSRALAERRVTARRLTDGMSLLSAVLPSEVVAAVQQSLRSAARLQQAAVPDEDRTLAQIEADLTAERLLGTPFGSAAPVAVSLVVSAETLLGDDCEPGLVPGCGHVPASVARTLVSQGLQRHGSTARRVFHAPGSTDLVAMESDSRLFTGRLRELVVAVRDHGVCRTPWCNAPAVHADHVVPARAGGVTSAANGQGLCVGCNHAKETVGWRHEPSRDDAFHHVVDIRTPTGHRYRSHAPPLPVPARDPVPTTSVPRCDLFWDGLELAA